MFLRVLVFNQGCPKVLASELRKLMFYLLILQFWSDLDLNVESQTCSLFRIRVKGRYVSRQASVFSVNGLTAHDHLSQLRGQSRVRSQGNTLQ